MTSLKKLIEKPLKRLNRRYYPQYIIAPPQWLVLGVNNVCNLHCKMCDVGTDNSETIFSQNLIGSTPQNMPLELFEKIVTQTTKYFPETKLGYAFTEPLIYKHLEASLELTKAANLYTTITTNGLKLKQKAQTILDNNVAELYVSLDGPEDIHNEIRGDSRSFSNAMAGIEALFSVEQRPKISIFCVITQWNIGQLKTFVDFFRQYPITHLGFMHTNFTPASVAQTHNLHYGNKYFASHSNVEQVSIEKMDLVQLWQEIRDIKGADYPFTVSFSPELKTEDDLNVFYRHPEKLLGKQCKDVFSNMMIKSDGSVIPAHGRCYNLNLGNVYQQEIKQIWNASPYAKLRQDLAQAGGLFPACSRCCSAFSN